MSYLSNKYEIADEYIIESVIEKFLNNIPDKLKEKIFYIYYSYLHKYKDNLYKKIINEKNANSISNILKCIIKIIKTNNIRLNELKQDFTKEENIILYCSNIIHNMYEHELRENNLIDFDDIIINATKKLKKMKSLKNYKHILVDEYQDISNIRFEFLKTLVEKNQASLTVVGDDWQSIYRFSGSNIEIFLKFRKLFPNSKLFVLKNTYRCPRKIIEKSSKFIIKNKLQIQKEIISTNMTKRPLKKVYYSNKYKCLYKIIKKIKCGKSILILSRNTYDIYSYTNNKLQYKNNKVYVNNKEASNIAFMSIHMAKGLEADIVILLNLETSYDGFPSKKELKIIDKLIGIKEPIKFPEERRLFYVALTRCREKIYLLINKNSPSVFADEI